MASLQKTYTGDLSTAITQRLLSAYFRFEDRNYIAQGKGGSNVSGKDPMVPGGGGRGPINPEIVTSTPFDGLVRKPTINNTATRQKGIVVRDKALGNFLAAVSISLSSSLNSINEKLDDSTEGITATKDGIDKTYKKLEQSGDSLETKLDAIIEALRYSNTTEKIKRDKKEADTKISEQKEAVDLSNANRILMQDMDRQEIRDMQADDLAEDDRGIINDGMSGEEIDTDNLPSLDKGGIVSGPDSGYLAVLHGDEAVVPLDNNFTQGQPSAVGEQPISEMPMMAERGITPGDNPSSMKPSFTPNVTMASAPNISFGGGGGSGMGEMLSKAIQLPAKAAGLVTMGLMNKVLKSGNISPKIVTHLKSMSAPISAAFGVPDILTADLAPENDGREDYSSTGGGKRRREKGLFGRFKDFILGTGGGSMTYRGGTGGNTYMNNRSSGTGGYGVGGWPFGGGKKEKTYKSKQDFGSILRTTASKDAYMVINGFGDAERFKKKYGLTAEQFLALPEYPTDQSSLDSNIFTKNVSYDNAFDYYDSPNYGLRTSEIAYNMSMEDELNSIVEGLADPNSQMVLNTQTAQQDSDNQIEYSAIAVRGNPLKTGTYISPYSV